MRFVHCSKETDTNPFSILVTWGCCVLHFAASSMEDAAHSELFGQVDALSSDDDAAAGPCAGLPRKVAKAKRKRGQSDGKGEQEPAAVIVSQVSKVREMLGNPKCHCKQGCLQLFVEDPALTELVKFRDDWAGMHKLDQDHVDSWN